MTFITPKEIIHSLNIGAGVTVADFGAGSGHYVFPIAKILGSGGKMYALDIQRKLLEKIKTEAEEEHLDNVEIIWADLEAEKGARLANSIVDKVLIANLLFQVPTDKRANVIREAFRVLKVGGEVAVLDWNDVSSLGPSALQRLTESEAERIFLENSFVKEKVFPAGDHHYGIIFKKTRD